MTPGRRGEQRRPGPSAPRRRTIRLSIVLAALALALVGTGTAADAQSIDDAREQREANRAEQARIAEELDTLEADAATISAALSGLDEALSYQQAKVDAATQALDQALAAAAAAQAEVDQSNEQITVIRQRVEASVVDAYTGGLAADTDQFLAAATVSEATQRTELLDVVRGRYGDDLETLRALKERQRRATEAAAVAVQQADAVRAELEAAKAELDAQRETQARLAEALQAKIGDVQAQADALEAAEDELTAVINRHLEEEAAARGFSAASAPSLTAASASGFIYPADGPVTSPFGYRIHPILGYSRLHSGTDIGASYGSPVWASKGGTVILAGWNGGYGNCVIIAHEGGLSTLYGHMSELAVSEGQRVGQGEVVGWVGSTGASTGPHLHFEVWVGGSATDPMNFL
ncbi:MAG: peptidoglycan DD-metalloendopeptidase family protein [Acidimicrobiales bacterium]